MPHPLKIICLLTLPGLLITQASLFLIQENPVNTYWALIVTLPLLLPIKGFLSNTLYTYRWTGFLTLFYFCIGISELFSNPELKTYALCTAIFSTLLFLACIYYARFLAVIKRQKTTSQG
ncbi:MAG: putative membrane protein [Gammaproteobacteria bacterium]|jgi:uncharacterized membrane protein